jgi:hypothetical protein
MSGDLGNATATSRSGPAPIETRYRASRFARAFSSAYETASGPPITAVASGVRLTCAWSSSGSVVAGTLRVVPRQCSGTGRFAVLARGGTPMAGMLALLGQVIGYGWAILAPANGGVAVILAPGAFAGHLRDCRALPDARAGEEADQGNIEMLSYSVTSVLMSSTATNLSSEL